MKILVACEESQAVCKAFRAKGHEVYSCDIEPCSGGHPEWHIQGDVVPLLAEAWDMIIAFPPCTYLTSACNRSYSLRMTSKEKVEARLLEREKAFDFFMLFANANCSKVAIENPLGHMSTAWRKPDQIIQPYFFGHPVMKRTCLWLKGLPKLIPTNVLPKPEPLYICQGPKSYGKKITWSEGMKGGGKERSKARSKTFYGVADAMAEQWG